MKVVYTDWANLVNAPFVSDWMPLVVERIKDRLKHNLWLRK